MTISVTPIFIPGLILTQDIFAPQIDRLANPAAAKTADTLGRDSITAMAEAALALADGALVLSGGLDALTPPQAARDMAELIPDAELVIMEEIGHLSTIEAPDEVTDILNAYLARLAA